VNIAGNNQNSTYHALNLQFTRRLTNGLTAQTTYIWSKAFESGNVVDPNRRNNKTVQGVDHAHQFSSSGSYELPVGAGHSFMGNAPGWVQNIVNKWQLGGVMNFTTGGPLSITSGIQTIGTAGARPNVVGEIPEEFGKITKLSNGVNYFDGFTQIVDPGFAQISPACAGSTTACNGLFTAYNNKAIVSPSGQLLFVNPQPGQEGTLGYNTLRGPSRFDFDMNLLKRFRITETKTFEVHIDAINILNHANFGAPSTTINGSGTFGRITTLASGQNTGGNGGMRSFLINTRINF
jgi:hypothetical protein